MKMEKYDCLVSIVIPVYNGSDFLKEAIDSALNQTYKNIEIIVVNDGSTDGGKTEKIAKSYGNKIKYYYKENGGVSSALNYGIKKMNGDYFSWLSHDDLYDNLKIENQINLLKKYDKKTLALCGTREIDKDSKIIKDNNFKETIIAYKSDEVLKKILSNFIIFGCSLLIPKTAFDECGMFDEKLKFSQDYLMWIKIFLNDYSLVYDSKTLVSCRIHDKQVTQTKRELYYKDAQSIYEIIKNDLVKKSNLTNNYYYLYAKQRAIRNTSQITKKMIYDNSKLKLLSKFQVFKLQLFIKYGTIRPYLRVIYYKLLKKTVTKK